MPYYNSSSRDAYSSYRDSTTAPSFYTTDYFRNYSRSATSPFHSSSFYERSTTPLSSYRSAATKPSSSLHLESASASDLGNSSSNVNIVIENSSSNNNNRNTSKPSYQATLAAYNSLPWSLRHSVAASNNYSAQQQQPTIVSTTTTTSANPVPVVKAETTSRMSRSASSYESGSSNSSSSSSSSNSSSSPYTHHIPLFNVSSMKPRETSADAIKMFESRSRSPANIYNSTANNSSNYNSGGSAAAQVQQRSVSSDKVIYPRVRSGGETSRSPQRSPSLSSQQSSSSNNSSNNELVATAISDIQINNSDDLQTQVDYVIKDVS